MEPKPIHLRIASHAKNLKQVRQMLGDVAGRLEIPRHDTADIILAVDEVCANIIRHGYENDPTKKISLSVTPYPEQLVIEISDSGISFDITRARPRNLEEIKPGGLGVCIIKKVMDHVAYNTTQDGVNHMKLIKKI